MVFSRSLHAGDRNISRLAAIGTALLSLAVMLNVIACQLIGLAAGGMPASYSGSYFIQLPEQQRPELLEAISRAGKSMGLRAAAVDATHQGVSFEPPTGAIIGEGVAAGFGTVRTFRLYARVDDNLHAIEVSVTVLGNFDYARKETADSIFREFQQRFDSSSTMAQDQRQ